MWVYCELCNRGLWVAVDGETLCVCGVRHTVVAPLEDS